MAMAYKDARCDTCKRAAAKTGYSDEDECPRCLVKRRWCALVARRQMEAVLGTRVCCTPGCNSTEMLEEDRDAGGDIYYCFSCWEEWEMENYARGYNAEQEECQSESDTDLDETAAAAQALKDQEWPTLSHSMKLQAEERELKQAKKQLQQSEQQQKNNRENGRLETDAPPEEPDPAPEISPSSVTAMAGEPPPDLFGKGESSSMIWNFTGGTPTH